MTNNDELPNECPTAGQNADATVTLMQGRMNNNTELGGQVEGRAKNGAVRAARQEIPPMLEAIRIQLPPNLVTTDNMGRAYAQSYEIMQQLDNRIYAVLTQHHVIEAAYKVLGLPWPPPGGVAPEAGPIVEGSATVEPLIATVELDWVPPEDGLSAEQ